MRIGIEMRLVTLGGAGGIAQLLRGVLRAVIRRNPQHEFVCFNTVFNRGLLNRSGKPAVKVETTSGVDSVPTLAANAVRLVGIPVLEYDFMESGDRDDAQTGDMSGADRAAPAGRAVRS